MLRMEADLVESLPEISGGGDASQEQRQPEKEEEATTDRDVLLVLYQETEGQSWHNNAGWGSDRPLDEWHGVTATSAGRVVALELRYNNLRGMLPPQLGKLNALEQLHLTNNELYGNIPQELGQLHALKEMRLYCNQLSGAIPPQIGRLCALKKLFLYSNKLSGVVPPELKGLHALEELLLADNRQLEGDIPPELDRTLALNRGESGLDKGLENVILEHVILDNSVLRPTPVSEHGSSCAGIFSPIASSIWDYTRKSSCADDEEIKDEQNRDRVAAHSAAALRKKSIGGRDMASKKIITNRNKYSNGGDDDVDDDDDSSNYNEKPRVARILDSIAEVWHVVVPVTDDLTSAWLLLSAATAGADEMGPLWWACALALAAAGIERAWLLVALCLTAALAPLLWCARAAAAGLASLLRCSARTCRSSPNGTASCLLLLACFCGCGGCRGCLGFAPDGSPPSAGCDAGAAARLFARLSRCCGCGCCCSSSSSCGGGDDDDDEERRISGRSGRAPQRTPPRPSSPDGGGGGGKRHDLEFHFNIFFDALLWALVGSRARCSRFWDGLGLSFETAAAAREDPRARPDGDGDAALAGATLGDVIDPWVTYHPFYWLGKVIFGKMPLSGSRLGSVRRRCSWCCRIDHRVKPGREGGSSDGGGGNDNTNGSKHSKTNDSKYSNTNGSKYSNNNSNNNGTPVGGIVISTYYEEGPSSPQRRRRPRRRRWDWRDRRGRRGRLLRRAVGETLVVDTLFLALSAVSGGGWNGSLVDIAGISAVFSALELLTELRYYVKESTRSGRNVSSASAVACESENDGDDGGGGSEGCSSSSSGEENSGQQHPQWSSFSSVGAMSSAAADDERSFLSSSGYGDNEHSSVVSEEETTSGDFDFEDGAYRQSGVSRGRAFSRGGQVFSNNV
ncbi:unnamed protein product [Pylaiella littoralis]